MASITININNNNNQKKKKKNAKWNHEKNDSSRGGKKDKWGNPNETFPKGIIAISVKLILFCDWKIDYIFSFQ